MRPLTTIEIIVAVLIIAFAVQFFVVYKKEAKAPSLTEAIKSGDLSQCEKISNKNDRPQCKGTLQSMIFSTKALESQDPKICLSIEDKFLQERCKDPFTVNEAITKKDISLCPSGKDTNGNTVFFKKICPETIYMNLAIEKKDASICKKITEKTMSDLCVKIVQSGVPPVMDLFGGMHVATSTGKFIAPITNTVSSGTPSGPFGVPLLIK